jgi:hypothetical protein
MTVLSKSFIGKQKLIISIMDLGIARLFFNTMACYAGSTIPVSQVIAVTVLGKAPGNSCFPGMVGSIDCFYTY